MASDQKSTTAPINKKCAVKDSRNPLAEAAKDLQKELNISETVEQEIPSQGSSQFLATFPIDKTR